MEVARGVVARAGSKARRLVNAVRGAFVDRYAPMWIDRPDAKDLLTKQSSLDPIVRRALGELIETGLAILPGNVPDAQCDALVDDFGRYCADHPCHRDYQDRHGLHDRLACLHTRSGAALRIGENRNVTQVLRAAFGRAPVIVGSLYFERGSQQDVHRDTPAFFTVPLNHFFGVWTALEDLHPDSGRLVYFPGGHRAIPDRPYVGSGTANMERYFSDVVDACQRAGLQLLEVNAKKGDTFIWHPQLPHGGSSIKDPSRSRRSIVFHYVPIEVPCYGAEQFFGSGKPSAAASVNYIRRGTVAYFDFGEPKFFFNRKEGNFDEV